MESAENRELLLELYLKIYSEDNDALYKKRNEHLLNELEAMKEKEASLRARVEDDALRDLAARTYLAMADNVRNGLPRTNSSNEHYTFQKFEPSPGNSLRYVPTYVRK